MRHKATGTNTNNQAVGLAVNVRKGHGNSIKKKSKKSSKKGPKLEQKSGSTTIAENDTNSKEDLAVVVGEHAHHTDEWVLNIEVFYYICQRRDWFRTYEQIERSNVSLANNFVYRIVGIGSI